MRTTNKNCLKSSRKGDYFFFALVVVLHLLIVPTSDAQILDRVGRQIERKAKDRANRKVDQAIDKGLDKVEGAIDESVKGGGGKPTSSPEDKGAGASRQSTDGVGESTHESSARSDGSAARPPNQPAFAAYSKYDFVPGEKIVAVEDFSQDEIGDFPARWNTNASGEIVRLEGSDAKWLALTSSGVLTPEFIRDLPENFTLEFDLAVSPDYSFYDQPLTVSVVELDDPKEFVSWERFGSNRKNGVLFSLHPQDAGSAPMRMAEFEVWNAAKKGNGQS
jgi:OOP family OmpA-OmpF porin